MTKAEWDAKNQATGKLESADGQGGRRRRHRRGGGSESSSGSDEGKMGGRRRRHHKTMRVRKGVHVKAKTLKRLLKSKGLKVSGKKSTLRARARKAHLIRGGEDA